MAPHNTHQQPENKMTDATRCAGLIKINFCVTSGRVLISTSTLDKASSGFLEEGVVEQPVKERESKIILVKNKMQILQFIDLIIPPLFLIILFFYGKRLMIV